MSWEPMAVAAIGAAGKAATAMPNQSASDQLASVGIDFSNWNVSTHGSTANQTATSGKPDSLAAGGSNWIVIAGFVLAAIVAVKWIAKKH